MRKTDDLLFEIGTEELPPKELQKLSEALAKGILAGLLAKRLATDDSVSRVFAAPRRLGVLVSAVAARQTAETIEKRGPSVSAAFTQDGAPTPAALGFARSVGVTVQALTRIKTDRGLFLSYQERRRGEALSAVLPGILDEALLRLPTGRRMRWGAGDTEFVRPVHWIVALHGRRALPMTVLAIKAGRRTYGHRFHAPKPLAISSARDYADILKNKGQVIADFAERRELVRAQSLQLATTIEAHALIEPDLLDLVTSLVEWPHAIMGAFDESFLTIPREALIAAMQDHQKYFPLERDGELLPRFITIANIESQDDTVIRKGNERVLAARFADARFFWQNDRTQSLAAHGEGLEGVAFEERLGSMAQKVARVQGLAAIIATLVDCNEAQARRAALLSKADLMTGMVGEFPELQGVMGGYYARHDGEDPAVATAIAEHYRPRFSGDALPETRIGRVVALADKLDTLVGIFGVGLAPTGDKDPFALRRAAIGILRLLDVLGEKGHDLDVPALMESAQAQFPQGLLPGDTKTAVLAFLEERLRHFLETSYPQDAVQASLAYGLKQAHDVRRRAQALAAFAQSAHAPALAAAHKRICNILKKNSADLIAPDTRVLHDPAEKRLAAELADCQNMVEEWRKVQDYRQMDYEKVLEAFGALRPAVDGFFEEVLVMTDDDQARQSRLALLSDLARLFETVGDLSCLKISGDAP